MIGLDLDPPGRSLVFCCDEKSQYQALERTQPSLPLGSHRVRIGTHDYIRHGTTDIAVPGVTFLRTANNVTITDAIPTERSAFYRFESVLSERIPSRGNPSISSSK